MEARGPEVQGHSSVHSEFRAILGPVKPGIKEEEEEGGGEGGGERRGNLPILSLSSGLVSISLQP